MRYFDVEGVRGSVLGFGCGSVMGRVGRVQSLTAMGAAWDAGINLFDVARSYGYGEAEGLVGEFLQARRAEAVIVTKFGIVPTSSRTTALKARLKPLVRSGLHVVPQARRLVQRATAGDSASGQFSATVLRSSLEQSLRQLRTDYVDVLLMHGPPTTVTRQEDLLAELDKVVEEGKVRLAGVSGGAESVGEVLGTNGHRVRVAQMVANIDDLSAIDVASGVSAALVIAHHPFGGPTGVLQASRALAALADDPHLPAEVRVQLRQIDEVTLADVVFGVLLRDTEINAIVPSMTSLDHLRANVAAIDDSRFNDAAIAAIRERLHARLNATVDRAG